jgi:predicted nuclease with TOPRIM domain
MLDRTGSVRGKSDEVRQRLAELRQEASELEQRVHASETCLSELDGHLGL